MVEPRHQPITPLGRYSGVKEPPIRSWDRNKARIESIYQLPTRDFRQTAAQFGVPLSVADLNTNEQGVPKMECTTTTKSDFCRPSLDRYVTVPGVCPDREYPSSSGLEYCGREPGKKPPQPANSPVMPQTKSTCPASFRSLSPSVGAIPKLNHPPPLPYPSCSANDEYSPAPRSYLRNHAEAISESVMKQPDYTPKVDYSSQQPGFRWPVPIEPTFSPNLEAAKPDVHGKLDYEQLQKLNLPKPDFRGGGESNIPRYLDYPVETEDHAEKLRFHDASIEMARKEYDKMIGSPGSTVPLVKAGVDPPSATAHYNVPDYTEGTSAGGTVRPKFGAPNVEMKVPITDPLYPKPDYKIPQPEAGLIKTTYTGMKDDISGKPGVAYTPPVRYPDKIYNPPHMESGGYAEVSMPLLNAEGGTSRGRYVPSIIEAQHDGQNKSPPTNNTVPSTPDNVNTNVAKTELPSLKGIRRIQTTNQVYGSWIDDPYLKDNDWWFKAKTRMPIQKTYLSKYKEENGWS